MQPSLLIAEDDLALRLLLHYYLRRRYRGRVAPNGREAQALVQEEQPDMIISDVIMPGGSGLDLHAVLGTSAAMRAIRFFFVSAVADEEAVTAHLHRHDDFMSKP